MRQLLFRLSCLSVLLSSIGCASLQSVSLTQVPADRRNEVSTTVDSWGVLGIFFNNDFADEARVELQAQCPNGDVKGIFTSYETYNYLFVYKREVQASGFCVARR